MSIAVYNLASIMNEHLQEVPFPHVRMFADTELSEALRFAEACRKSGFTHVSICTELANSVGKPGVSSVENGKTPDGHDYEWTKKQRGARPASKDPA